jgi:DNA-directed RNA polymerase specialized sigma24 family protein
MRAEIVVPSTETAYTPPNPGEHALLERGATAARYAARRIENHIVLAQDLEDMTQEAAFTYYETLGRTGSDAIAFSGAIRAAHRCFVRQCVGRNPFADSLDEPNLHGKDRLEYSTLDLLEVGNKSAWLSSADLLALAREIGRYKRPKGTTFQFDALVLRLLLEGYDNAAIAIVLGRSEGSIKGKRKTLKANLKAYCEENDIPVPELPGPGGWRRAHDSGLSGKRLGRRS